MTTSATSAPGRRFPFGKLLVGMLAGFVLALSFGAGALLAYQGQYADRIYPGVEVDGIDVSGLTREAAAARLRDGLAGYGDGTVVLVVDGDTVRVPYADLGRRADVDALVERAWAVGREQPDTLGRASEGIRSLVNGTRIGPVLVLDPDAVNRELAAAATVVDQASVSASAKATTAGFVTSPAVPGAALPRDEIAAALAERLTDPAAPETLELSFATVPVAPSIDDAEAAAAVATADRMAADLVLAHGTETWTLPAATVRAWITFAETGDGYAPTIAPTAPTKALKKLAKTIDKPAKEASFRFTSSGVRAVASGNGRAVDVKATAPLVAAAIAGRADGSASASPVALAMNLVKPRLTTDEAKKLAPRIRKVSSWTTYYEVSERNGFGNNISIPARDLDGTVVAPGAVFDFWQSIGPVAYARGYRDGGAIIDGKSAPTGALGGGICSTSTTLFNAVARAGYKMLARHNHYYYITRYPTGLDATVAISNGAVTTMSWKNDSDYPVLIRSSARPGVLTFSIYTVAVNDRPSVGGGSAVPGSTNVTYRVANGRTVVFRTSPKRNYSRATSSVQRTTSLPAGRVKVLEYPDDGFDVTVTRTVKANGKLLSENTWNSHYARVNGLTLIGAR